MERMYDPTVIELHEGYWWDCHRCGVEVSQRKVQKVFDPRKPKDAAEIRRRLGLGPNDPLPTDELVRDFDPPEGVTCKYCGAFFPNITVPDHPADRYGAV